MPKELNVGQFADGYSPITDGVVTVIKNYAYWLNEKYGSCTVYAPQTPGYEYDDPFKVKSFFSVPIPKLAPYRAGLPALDLDYRLDLQKAKFDIVHSHAPFMAGQEALRIGKKRKIPVVTTFHTKYYDDFKNYFNSEFIAKKAVELIVNFYNKVDSVWTVNHSTVKTLREYGYEGEVIVVENGTDMCPPQDLYAARIFAETACGCSPDQPLFIFVGQHEAKKNTPMIIEAAKLIKERCPNFRLAMIGRGTGKKELEKMAEELDLEDNVKFLGVIYDREELAAIYSRANALVFPSLYDNAPLVVKEAASLGCPSIMVRGSTAAENTTDGDNVFLCDNSKESLCEVMLNIINNPEKAATVGKKAMQTLPRTWESVVDEVYEHYCNIIERYKSTH